MSVDEFDPAIERLFSRAPSMPDADLFALEMETRLNASVRVRTLALWAAGLVGGVVAVRETVSVNLSLGEANPITVAGQQLSSANAEVQAGLSQLGLGSVTLGAMDGMQLFWITAAALVALLAAGAIRLSQEV
jgi:hypothetical protein